MELTPEEVIKFSGDTLPHLNEWQRRVGTGAMAKGVPSRRQDGGGQAVGDEPQHGHQGRARGAFAHIRTRPRPSISWPSRPIQSVGPLLQRSELEVLRSLDSTPARRDSITLIPPLEKRYVSQPIAIKLVLARLPWTNLETGQMGEVSKVPGQIRRADALFKCSGRP